ncbi:MAG: hypothetical protein ACTHN4_06540 [Sphingomicrobium sp.]
MTVVGYGATFAGDLIDLVIQPDSRGYNLHGLTIIETSGNRASFPLDCYGAGCHFKDLHLEKSPPAAGYIAYCREMTFGNVFENISFSGSNGICLGGHDHQIIGGWAESSFGDDCWAIKSATYPCYNIQISGFQARRFGALVSIGSEIGTPRADNPDRSRFVRNVAIENCSADECTYFAYIKPGGVESIDYRDGLVEGVAVKNCQLTDSSGRHFRDGIFVAPGRGAIVRGITIQDVTITARGATPAVQTVAGLYMRPSKTTDGAGLGGAIENVLVSGLRCIDPFEGAATSASAPGTPIHSLVAIEKADPIIGRVGQVEVVDSVGNGCARMAVALGPNLEGPVTFSRCTFENFAAAVFASTDKGSVMARSPVTLSDITAIPASSSPPDTRGVMPDAKPDKTIDYRGDSAAVAVPSVAPGESAAWPLYTSNRDTWISKVEVSVEQAIPASNTNFVRFTLRNSSNGAVLATATTSSGLLAQAGVPVSLNGDIQFSGAAASIPKGAQLAVEISQGGAGASVTNPTFTVHCVPFGAA